MHPKICAFCGKEFVALSAKGKYCSLECNNKAFLKRQFERRKKEHPEDVLVCPCCGKEFFRSKANPVYCSYVCKRKMEPPKPQPKRLSSKTTGYLAPKRKCHDCKRPTDNYRCPECWEKYRAPGARNAPLFPAGEKQSAPPFPPERGERLPFNPSCPRHTP